MYKLYFKRLIDVVLSTFMLLLLLPVYLIVSFLIKVTSSGPVLFKQLRIGKNEDTFLIYKFRTMTDTKRDFSKQIVGNEVEVTKVGRVIRRLKIDELPQLLNVLKGDMSIIGPRPCLPKLVEDFNDDAKFRILVRPGITGLAQVSGNIHLDWNERWKLDRKYVERISFLLDIKIILRTLLIILLGEKWGLKI